MKLNDLKGRKLSLTTHLQEDSPSLFSFLTLYQKLYLYLFLLQLWRTRIFTTSDPHTHTREHRKWKRKLSTKKMLQKIHIGFLLPCDFLWTCCFGHENQALNLIVPSTHSFNRMTKCEVTPLCQIRELNWNFMEGRVLYFLIRDWFGLGPGEIAESVSCLIANMRT